LAARRPDIINPIDGIFRIIIYDCRSLDRWCFSRSTVRNTDGQVTGGQRGEIITSEKLRPQWALMPSFATPCSNWHVEQKHPRLSYPFE